MRRTVININKLRPKIKGTLEIHCGDYNLPPYDPTIVSDIGFYANRYIPYTIKRTNGTLGRCLYNPSWKIFGGACGALGTHYYDNIPDGPWHVLDQIILDPNLVLGSDAIIEVITNTSFRSLAKRTGIPSKERASDHFPVLVTLP